MVKGLQELHVATRKNAGMNKSTVLPRVHAQATRYRYFFRAVASSFMSFEVVRPEGVV